jgi:hypothetical protein
MDEDLEPYFESLGELCSLAEEFSTQNKLPDAYCDRHRARSEAMIHEAHAGLENLPLSDAKRSRQRIDEIYDQMQLRVEQQRRAALHELETMTPRQQEEAVGFWQGITGFFSRMFSWLGNAFRRIVEFIKKGLKIVAKVAQIFAPIVALIGAIFAIV